MAAYEAARAAAEQHLVLGRTVVVDAVNDSEPARDTWRAGSASTGARLVFVLLTLDDETEHRRRLEGRLRSFTNIPEPSWDDVLARAAAYAPWDDGCVRVGAEEPVARVALTILNQLRAP